MFSFATSFSLHEVDLFNKNFLNYQKKKKIRDLKPPLLYYFVRFYLVNQHVLAQMVIKNQIAY